MLKVGPLEIFLFICFLFNIGLGILVFTRSSSAKRINTIFSLFCLACALWIFGALMIHTIGWVQWKLASLRFIFALSFFIPATFVHFSLIFPDYQRQLNSLKTLILYLPALIFLVLSPTDLIAKAILRIEPIKIEYGIIHRFVVAYFVIYLSLGFYFLVGTYRKSTGIRRLQIKYCFVGLLLMATIAVTTNLLLPMLGTSRLSGLGSSSSIIMISFVSYSIIRHRLMDINFVFKKGTTYVFLMFFLFVPSLLFILFSQKVFFNKISYLFSAVIVALLFLVTILFYRIKPQTEKMVEEFLFKNRFDSRKT